MWCYLFKDRHDFDFSEVTGIYVLNIQKYLPGYYIINLYQNFSIKMNVMLNKNNRDMIH